MSFVLQSLLEVNVVLLLQLFHRYSDLFLAKVRKRHVTHYFVFKIAQTAHRQACPQTLRNTVVAITHHTH